MVVAVVLVVALVVVLEVVVMVGVCGDGLVVVVEVELVVLEVVLVVVIVWYVRFLVREGGRPGSSCDRTFGVKSSHTVGSLGR